MKDRITILMIGITVLCWSFAYPAIRVALQSFAPVEIAAARLMVAALLLGTLFFVRRPPLPPRRFAVKIVMIALSGFVLYNIALNTGQKTVPSAMASALINTVPMWTAILSALFLGEVLTTWDWAGLAISMTGTTLIAMEKGEFGGSYAGLFLVLIAAVCQATYFILQRSLLAQMKAIDLTTIAIVTAAVLLMPVAPDLLAAIPAARPASVFAVIALGIFPTALAFFTWTYVLSKMPPAKAAVNLYLVPVVTTVIAYFWIGEVPSTTTVVGALLTMSGVFVVNTFGKASAPKPASAGTS